MISEQSVVRVQRPLSPAMKSLLAELASGSMNISAGLSQVGNAIGDAVYGLAVQHLGNNSSHTLVTWSRSGQDPQRVRKVLTERMRMGGILEVDCGEDVSAPVTNSVIQFPVRNENDDRIGSLTAFVEHHTLSDDHCALLCELATVLSVQFSENEVVR